MHSLRSKTRKVLCGNHVSPHVHLSIFPSTCPYSVYWSVCLWPGISD